PGEVTIISLGPLTNIATVITREPTIATLIDRLCIVGGSLDGIGNITPTAEFNMYFDAKSAREIFRSAISKTMIPLNLTGQVEFGFDFLDHLSQKVVSSFLYPSVQHLFQNFRQHLGRETFLLNDAVGLIAAIYPELVETTDLAGDVEVAGELTRGVTVFDRRETREWKSNIDVGISIDAEMTQQKLIDLLP
ncbi:MAG: nucleoside hydrolase, partial [Planctomycetota bacterium]|nr:nucleoside hydrolase [Planctomycetota bacterium]